LFFHLCLQKAAYYKPTRLTKKSSFGTMQTVYLKEHEGNAHNFVGTLSSAASAPWWSAFGSQSVHQGESCGQVKPFSLELPNCIDQLAATKPLARGADQVLGKGHITQFTIFPGI